MNNFNFKFVGLNKKEDATKSLVLGVILLAVGVFCLLSNTLGVKLISYAIGAILLIFAYFNLKNINERSRYQSKQEIRPYTNIQWILLICAVTLFVFPVIMPKIFSSLLGAYVLANQLILYIRNKNNPNFVFGNMSIFLMICGVILIVSPLFLANLIAKVLALGIVLFSFYLISNYNSLRK